MINYGGSMAEFLNASIWRNELIPTGLYNYVLSIPKRGFYESGGTHGVYGSYLVIVFFVNYQIYSQKKQTISLILLLISLFNILILTSRESFLLLSILVISVGLNDFRRLKLKKIYIYMLSIILVSVLLLMYLNINIGIINKLSYTIDSIDTTGTEGNIHARFILWTVLISAVLINPLFFLIGTGYNASNYQHLLSETANQIGEYKNFNYFDTTENFFFLFLVYGGVISLFLSILFWLGLLVKLKSVLTYSLAHYMFFFLTLGLVITNNTGGSMLSDMFMIQYGLVYIWLAKLADNQKYPNAG